MNTIPENMIDKLQERTKTAIEEASDSTAHLMMLTAANTMLTHFHNDNMQSAQGKKQLGANMNKQEQLIENLKWSTVYSSNNVKSETVEPTPQQVHRERHVRKDVMKRQIGKRSGKWKFHDLSDDSDGLGRRKRTFCNSRLENEILQLYRNRINIKQCSGQGRNGGQQIVVEPNLITDPDMIKYNTGLRIVFDKKGGIYQLQVLPFTIEQGPLSNKEKLMTAVSRMLGDNGEVLCPGMAFALLNPNSYLPSTSKHNTGRCRVSNDGQLSTPHHQQQHSMKNATANQLLLSLNEEISRKSNQTRTSSNMLSDVDDVDMKCLLWHCPVSDPKWCSNCLRKRASMMRK